MKIGYCRVSRAGQDHALQLDALERAGCEKVFTEVASGAKDEREELGKALDFARQGDQLVVYSLGRLSRSLRHLLTVVDDLNRRGIELRSLTEAIDTTSPSGKMWFHMCAVMQQAELDTLRQRTRDGLAAARSRGRVGGRPRSLDEGKLRVARALMASNELSMAEIAAQVGVAPSTLYRALPGGRGGLGGASA